MAETQIEWTDATWNPVAGCTIVSAGCTNCYAMEMARRLQAMDVEKYKGLTRRSGKRTIWNGIVREDQSALDIPLRWKKPKKIFVNSMSDLFHERVSDAFILKVWDVMRATPHHHYQILTKRPERMGTLVKKKIADVLPNVWLGTSIENEEVVGLHMLAYDPSEADSMLYVFDEAGRAQAKTQLHDDIPRFIANYGDTIGVGDFYAGIYNATPAHMLDINSAIIDNPDLEVITEDGGERRKANTIRISDTLRMKNQRSFFPMFFNDQAKKK